MASETAESEKLRKQIKFLEALISSANTTNNVRSEKQPTSRSSHLSHKSSFDNTQKHSSSIAHTQQHSSSYANTRQHSSKISHTRQHSSSIVHSRPHSYEKPYSNTGCSIRNNHTKYAWRKGWTSDHYLQSYGRDANERDVKVLSRNIIDHTTNLTQGGEKRSLHLTDKSEGLSVENKNYISVKNKSGLVQSNTAKDTKALSKFQEDFQWKSKSHINRASNNEEFRSLYKWNRNSEAAQKVETCPNQTKAHHLNRSFTIVERIDHFSTDRNKISEQKTIASKDNKHTSGSKLPAKSLKQNIPSKDGLLDGKSNTVTPQSSQPINSITNISSKHKSLCKDILKTQTKLLELKRNLIEKKTKSRLSQAKKDFHPSQPSNSFVSRGKSKCLNTASFYSSTYKKPYKTQHLSYKKYTKYWREKLTHQRSSMKYPDWSYSRYIGRARGKHRLGFSNYRTRMIPSYLMHGFGIAGRPFIQHYYFLKTPFYQRHQLTKQHVMNKLNLKRRIERQRRLQDQVIFDPKKKLDRRHTGVRSRPQNFVMINGMLYKRGQKSLIKASSSASSSDKDTDKDTNQSDAHHKIKFLNTTAMKTVTVRGVKFKVDRDGKSLKKLDTNSQIGTSKNLSGKRRSSVSRVDIGGVTYRQTKPGTLERVTSRKNRVIATRVLNKSVVQATSKHLKSQQQQTSRKQQYCMFYNRFGKCNRQDKCPYIHDPDRITICTRFLRGTCQIKACPFSHKVSVEKMPVCSYYLKGMCNKQDCPYLHVNVNRDAEICQDFVNGFCPLGKKCKKKHSLICPVFMKTGTCPNGKKCRLQHRKTRKVKQGKSGQSSNSESTNKTKNIPQEASDSVEETTCDIHLPFKERRLPAYISLIVKNDDVSNPVPGTSHTEYEDTESLKIRPQFEKP